MSNSWQFCKNILCIRPDNMGDLIMTGPAIRALKNTFNARITVLTSSMAAGIGKLMPEIDEVMTADLPWVKTTEIPDINIFNDIVHAVREKKFDAAVIFTVYSQNPLPTVMLAYLAGIPLRLAYCRENPYKLLTNWVPDKEPYTLIKHQVRRDLDLVASVGAATVNEQLFLQAGKQSKQIVLEKLTGIGCNSDHKWLILHPGVSETKRQYPTEKWIAVGKILRDAGYQLLITGSASEKALTKQIQNGIGVGCFATGGLFNLDELVTLIDLSSVIIAVNTGVVHIAAALQTPVVVLYALTNPQHTPWASPHQLMPFTPVAGPQSRNEVISFVRQQLYTQSVPLPGAQEIFAAVTGLLKGDN
jgi:lipopolysaccharide heptosyltransferase II